MTALSSQERYSYEEVEEVIEEIKPSLFSAEASSSQHTQDYRYLRRHGPLDSRIMSGLSIRV
jgi:hypothetical protein